MNIVRSRYTRLLSLCLWLAGTCVAEPPAWFDENGPTPAVQQAIEVLAHADADGLEVRDYGVERLRAMFAALRGDDETLDTERQNHFASELTAAMTRYLNDLHHGRLDPRRLGVNYPRANNEFDTESWLSAAVSENRLPRAIAEVVPAYPQYPALIAELARYRKLIGDPAWRNPLSPLPGGKILPGQSYADLARLGKRLQQLGDLTTETTPPNRYEGALIDGIKSFQERHALPTDGVLGSGTLFQLNVPPEVRVRQIELALERLRWTPSLDDRRHIVVNIPEFTLRAYEFRDGRSRPVLKMRVIVGKVGKTATPLFYTEMRVVEFSPNWNVPPSIAKGETLPRLRRDPGYLQRAGMEFVAADGKVAAEYSSANLDAVERGQLRLRQKPSRGNALGQIKFILPNTDGIYLHHTPTPQLFRRERRDLSHGCVRVEAPVDLASFVLADQPTWTRERIVKAMERGKSSFATLRDPLPVIVTYSSAVYRDRRLYFFPDIYEQDRHLAQALQHHANNVKALSNTRAVKNFMH
ncbi:MAG: L,D-transpeptidase family protein [Candidatus Accumulibacter sp.]|nr:L,D-transpeptidase family protein [Accumulibacter sp.]